MRPPKEAIEAPHGALDLRVSGVADQNHIASFARIALHFHMHLGHKRTGGIKHREPAARGRLDHRARHAMRREDHGRPLRHLSEILDKHGTQAAQALDDVEVMHDLMTHIDRRTEQFERALHDIDGAIDASAETARIGEQDLHQVLRAARRLSSNASRSRSAAPIVIEESATLNAGNSAWCQCATTKSIT